MRWCPRSRAHQYKCPQWYFKMRTSMRRPICRLSCLGNKARHFWQYNHHLRLMWTWMFLSLLKTSIVNLRLACYVHSAKPIQLEIVLNAQDAVSGVTTTKMRPDILKIKYNQLHLQQQLLTQNQRENQNNAGADDTTSKEKQNHFLWNGHKGLCIRIYPGM